jgi:hypothetical protein
MNSALHIFRSHKIFDHFDPNILIPLDGTAKVDGTEFFANRIPSIEIAEAPQVIIQIQPTVVIILHHPP